MGIGVVPHGVTYHIGPGVRQGVHVPVVQNVPPGTPIRVGDVLLSVNGKPLVAASETSPGGQSFIDGVTALMTSEQPPRVCRFFRCSKINIPQVRLPRRLPIPRGPCLTPYTYSLIHTIPQVRRKARRSSALTRVPTRSRAASAPFRPPIPLNATHPRTHAPTHRGHRSSPPLDTRRPRRSVKWTPPSSCKGNNRARGRFSNTVAHRII